MGRFARRLFGLSLDEVTFARRRFRGGQDPAVREHVEEVGRSFLHGYHAAFEDDRLETLVPRLEEVVLPYRGFSYEGAAMSLTLLDTLLPGRPYRLAEFAAGAGNPHIYMAYVGAGWAMARLPFGMGRLMQRLAHLDPLLCWLALDGYGFHQGYFHWPRAVEGSQEIPRRVRGYAQRVFDQGLGRSLWFVDGADVERIPRTIGRFPAERQADLWAGIGLSSAYAGGVAENALAALLAAAGPYRPQLLQGAAFAAEARRRAGNLVPQTEMACQVYSGLSATEIAITSDQTRTDLPPGNDEEPAYEIWRQRIQQTLTTLAPATVG